MQKALRALIPGLRAAACTALCAAVLCGCTQQGASSAASEPAAQLDPITGQEALYPGQRPVAVVIDNASDTSEQWGVSTASAVLEAVTESDSSTKLCLVYPAVEAVPKVGPVAAGRDIYWRMLAGQQIIPVQRGGGAYNENYLDYYNITPIDALVVGRNAFSCPVGAWDNSPPWYTNGRRLGSVMEELNISAEIPASGKTVLRRMDEQTGEEVLSLPPLLSFGQGELPEADMENACGLHISFDAANATSFAYDAEAAVYLMQRADGSALMDAANGTQAAFDNLLVLYSAPSLRDDGETLDYDLSVGGGVWLHGGCLYNITWRQGSGSTFAFYDADGRQLDITPGRSYIALVASLTGDELTVTDAAEQELSQIPE